LPRPLARLLPEHEVRTVAAMGWTGIRNSELPIAVVVLVAPTNRIESLRSLMPALLRTLQTVAPHHLVRVGG